MKIILIIANKLLGSLSYKYLIKLGRFIGLIGFYSLPSRRRVAIKNAEIIKSKNPYQVAKESFKNSFASFLEIFFIKKIDKKFIDTYVEIDGETEEKFRRLKEQFNTYFVVGAHLGSWEIGPKIFTTKYDEKVCIVGRSIKNKEVDNLIKNLRGDKNIIYLKHRHVAFEIGKLIDNKILVGTLLDHSAIGKDAIYVDFFGHKTSFIAGIPLLSVKKNIPIVPMFNVRVKGKLKLICYEPILPDKQLKPRERIYDVARRINVVFEDIISKYPEQWYLLHKRFKRVKKHDSDKETYSLY